MTDSERHTKWPGLWPVVTELRCANRPGVADCLVDAVAAGARSGEILGRRKARRSSRTTMAGEANMELPADVVRTIDGLFAEPRRSRAAASVMGAALHDGSPAGTPPPLERRPS